MVDKSGPDNPGSNPAAGAPLDCEQWEALLADKMDGTLAPGSEAAFAEHSGFCPGCEGLLEQARKGQEWLKLLEEHVPAAPVDLLSRILAKTQGAGRERDYAIGTSGLGAAGMAAHGAGRWGLAPAALLAARGAHNARMVMTGAMAFFSVALTLSVAGVSFTSVHAAELRPQVVQANMSRSFYGTKKQVVSFYENLRLVYEVESKMHELRHDSDPVPAQHEVVPPQPGAMPAQPRPAAPTGQAKPNPRPEPKAHASSFGAGGRGPVQQEGYGKRTEQVEEVLHGWPVLVNYAPGAGDLLYQGGEGLEQQSFGSPRRIEAGPQGSKEQEGAVSSRMLRGATSKERNRT